MIKRMIYISVFALALSMLFAPAVLMADVEVEGTGVIEVTDEDGNTTVIDLSTNPNPTIPAGAAIKIVGGTVNVTTTGTSTVVVTNPFGAITSVAANSSITASTASVAVRSGSATVATSSGVVNVGAGGSAAATSAPASTDVDSRSVDDSSTAS